MYRRALALCIFVSVGSSFAAAADNSPSRAKLSATEIVDRNISARGGLAAWRAVQTLSMSGKVDAGGNNRATLPVPGPKAGRQMPPTRPAEQAQLPLLVELKRSHKSRMEVQFNGQTAIQVFDGTNGWKLRPFLNRRDVEPFTAEELKTASQQAELDGPLVDYAAKGTKVELVAMEKIEDRDTYKLKLTMKSGQVKDVWIDAATYLEAKIEGTPRRLDGKYHPVEVYYRDYRSVDGLKIPFVLETKVQSLSDNPKTKALPIPSEKIVLDKVEINPKLTDSQFTKAQLDGGVNGTQAASVAKRPLQ